MSELPEEKSVQKVGTGMIIIGWVIALALLTWVFNDFLQEQQRPNSAEWVAEQDSSEELVLRANRQHQYIVAGRLNDVPVDFLLDTGASQIALPISIARAAGLELGRQVSVETASGIASAQLTVIPEVEIGPFVFRNIEAVAIEGLGGYVLLGMNALGDLTFIQENNQLILRR